MKIFKVEDLKGDLEEIVGRIHRGEVFIYPTDTVYGIGCDALNTNSVKRIFEIKKRDVNKPFSVAFSNLDQIGTYVLLEGNDELELKKNLPGPYTFILKNKEIPRVVIGKMGTIGVRIPDYQPILDIIEGVGGPIITTSVNLEDQEPANSVEDIPKDILDRVDFVIDGGNCGSGKPSKIINLIDNTVLR